MSLGCPDKYRTPSAVSESWSYNLCPSARIKICEFVQHNAVESQTAQGVVIISPEQSDLTPIWIIHPQFARIRLCPKLYEGGRRTEEIVPSNRFCLRVGWAYVRKPRIAPVGADSFTLEIVNAGNRLSSAPMTHQTGKPLCPIMKRLELRTGLVVYADYAVVRD
jgi:hypothetical protein